MNYFGLPEIAGLSAKTASGFVSFYWAGSMVGRFLGAPFLRRVKAGHLLALAHSCATALVMTSMILGGNTAMWTILAVGLFNSIMFPTIFSLGGGGTGSSDRERIRRSEHGHCRRRDPSGYSGRHCRSRGAAPRVRSACALLPVYLVLRFEGIKAKQRASTRSRSVREMAIASVALQDRPILAHSARTAVTAIVSLAVARLFSLPEAYWAPITTLVIVQSSLNAALKRLVGTSCRNGAGLRGWRNHRQLLRTRNRLSLALASLFWVCFAQRRNLIEPAYRFAGITLAIVFLVPRTGSAWQIAFDRSAEVSIGIVVALLMTLIWPESE